MSKISALRSILVLVVVTAVALLGSTYAQQKPVVTIWQPEAYGLEAVEAKVEEITGVDLQIVEIPMGSYSTKVATTLVAQNPAIAPDILMVDSISLGEFAEGGFLSDITDVVSDEAANWFDDFRKGSQWPPGSGKFYAIWYDTDVRVTFYWPDLLREAGVNPGDLLYWDTYIEACKKLKKVLSPRGIGGCWLDMAGSWAPDFEFFEYLWQEGGEILKVVDGKWVPAFNSPAGVKAMKFLADRVKAGIDPQTETFWGSDFAGKRWAVCIHGNWASSLSRFPGTTAADRMKMIAALPYPVSEPGKIPYTLAGGWTMTIPKVIKDKAPGRFNTAVKVMEAYLKPEVMTDYYVALARIPVRVLEEPYRTTLAENIEFFDFYSKMASIARTRPAIPQWSAVSDAIFEAMSDVAFKGTDPKEALDRAAAKVEQILK